MLIFRIFGFPWWPFCEARNGALYEDGAWDKVVSEAQHPQETPCIGGLLPPPGPVCGPLPCLAIQLKFRELSALIQPI